MDSTTPLSPDHPLTHTTPTLVPILYRTTRMVVRVPPAMSPGLSASMAEVAAMSDSVFLEDEEEEDGEEEEEEMEESLDSDSVSEDVEDEGPTTEDEDPAAGEEGLAAGDEGPGIGVESLSLGGDEVVPEGQSSGSVPESERPERVSALRQPTLTTWIDSKDGTQDHDSNSEVDEQVIVVPSFPSNSFAAIAEILTQAEAADRDPAGIDSAGGVSVGSTSAGSDPVGNKSSYDLILPTVLKGLVLPAQ
ncbi:hypothetical protein Tco_0290655, partial [Tanacetum coccineum]